MPTLTIEFQDWCLPRLQLCMQRFPPVQGICVADLPTQEGISACTAAALEEINLIFFLQISCI